MRKICLNKVSQKDFVPNDGHRICTKHFTGGRKNCMNNGLTIVPKTIKPAGVKPRKTCASEGKRCLLTGKDDKGDGEDKRAFTETRDLSHVETIHFLWKRLQTCKFSMPVKYQCYVLKLNL